MAWLILLMIALFITGSFLQVMPTQKDRKQAELLSLALQQGFRPTTFTSRLPAIKQVVRPQSESYKQYGFRCTAPKTYENHAQWVRTESDKSQWQLICNEPLALSSEVKAELQHALDALPLTIVAVETFGQELYYYVENTLNPSDLEAMALVRNVLFLID